MSDTDSTASSRSSSPEPVVVHRPDGLVHEATQTEQAPVRVEEDQDSQSRETRTTPQQLTPGLDEVETDAEADDDADSKADEDPDAEADTGVPPKPVYGPDAEPLHVLLDEIPQSDELPEIGLDVVVIHGLYGSCEDASQSGPGSGTTHWVQKFADSFDGPRRVLRFEYEPLKLFAGRRSREAIRLCAIKLLRAIHAVREHDVVRRLITFVAHDIGGIILKEAIITASLGNNSWMDVFEMSRILVFQGVPHRSLDHLDMEERLSRFFYASYESDAAAVRPSVSSIPDFAATVIEINGCFVEAQIPLRSQIISVHGQDKEGDINPVFDRFCASMGIPLERRYLKNDSDHLYDGLVEYLERVKKDMFMPVDADHLLYERKILALSSPIYPFKTAKTENLVADSPIYKSWLAHPGPQILYVHGSDRVREVAEQIFYSLEDVAEKETKRTIVLYFSFDRWDVRADSLRDMLSTFLAQIMCHFPGLGDQIKVTFARLRLERGWTEADLIYLFERFRFTDQVDHVMFVINHFDECTKGSQKLFLENFAYLSRASELPWKIVVTSHKPGALSNELADPWAVNLNLADVNLEPIHSTSFEQDMTRLIKLRPDLNLLGDAVREELQVLQGFDPLVRHIVWEQARVRPDWPDKATTQEIFGPLDVLPGQGMEEHNLKQVLQWAFKSIPEQPTLRRILTWLLYSVRPLSVWELASIIYLGSEHDHGDVFPGASALQDLVSKIHTWFAGIMSIEQNEVKIIHPRLRNILMGKDLVGEEHVEGQSFLWEEIRESAHLEITKLCLELLSRPSVKDLIDSTFQSATSEAFESPISPDRSNLCSYALQAWTHHYLLSPRTDELQDILSQHASTELAHIWARGYWALSNPVARSSTCLESLFPVFAGLGQLDVVQARGEEDVRQGLLEAASKNHAETVLHILEDLWEPSFSSDSQLFVDALMASAACGDEGLMLNLLDRFESMADYEASKLPPSLMHRSAWLGLHRFADRILSLGCDPDVQAAWTSTVVASPLSQAARNYQVKTVQTLLKHNADANYKHRYGRTPIHHVAAQGHAEVAKILVEEGKVDLESTDDEGLTTLYFSCLWGQHHVAEVLLGLGADPNMGIKADGDRRDWSPLVVAADDGYERCVQLLLKHHADPNLPGPGEDGTALRYAAVKGHINVCRLLLEKGADPNSALIQPSILYQVLFYYQGTKNQEEVFELLLAHGADANVKDADGEPLLLAAVSGSKTLFVQKLLDHGADVEITNSSDNTALLYAASKQEEDIVDMFLEKNANPNVPNNMGHTALYCAVPSASIVKKLLEKGADPNAFRGDFTCLMYAAWTDQRDSMQLLLDHNASLEDEWRGDDDSLQGHTALSMAISWGQSETVTLLAEAGGNLKHVTAATATPVIHHAAAGNTLSAMLGFPRRIDVDQKDKNGCAAVHLLATSMANLRLLVNAGAEINVQDGLNKDTPLTVAALNGQLDRVEFLISRGANLELGSPSDGTALTQACGLGHFDIAKHLVEKGADVNAPCEGNNGSPLQAVCSQDQDSVEADTQAEMIDYLIEHGASVSGKAGWFGYAINAASLLGRPRLLSQLLDNGASVDVQDDLDRSPMHFAALNGIGNFKVVLDAGGDVKARDATGRLPIHWAAQAGRIQVLRAIDSVVPIRNMVNDTDIDGWTPLCWAARGTECWCRAESSSEEADQMRVMRFLIENGADRNMAGTVGGSVWTPLKIAKFHGQSPEVLDLLRHGLEPPPDTVDGEEAPAEREEDESRTGTHLNIVCDVCQAGLRGYEHRCTTRKDFDLCFKCVERAKDLRALENDSFEEKGTEFEDGDDEEEEKKSDTTDSDTDSDSDSDSESDSD